MFNIGLQAYSRNAASDGPELCRILRELADRIAADVEAQNDEHTYTLTDVNGCSIGLASVTLETEEED